jgi:hypothetical protein
MIREYASALEYVEVMTEKTRQFTAQMEEVTAEQLGLDTRSLFGYAYVDESAIVVNKEQAHNLEYYGGFVYVDKEYRREVGDYVFYLSGDDRVYEHIAQALKFEERG